MSLSKEERDAFKEERMKEIKEDKRKKIRIGVLTGLLLICIGFFLYNKTERIPATTEECASNGSLVKAVIDRGLGPLQILYCYDGMGNKQGE